MQPIIGGNKAKHGKFPYKHTFDAQLKDGNFMTIIMQNSGIYKKHCVQMVLYIMAMAWALCCECVCAWAFSKPRQPGSQELYQSARPPCEMSSHSRRLWDCCRHPNALWMSASLTGQLAYTAMLTTQLHFQLLFFNFSPLICPAQRLSVAEKMTNTILKQSHSIHAEEASMCRWACVEVNIRSVCII